MSAEGLLRIGVAGLGGMGVVHVHNARSNPNAKLVAVAAARPGRAEEVAQEIGEGVRACTYEELFAADDLDAIVLAARSIDHADRAVEVLRNGKHLLLEKPGAATLAGHDRLSSEAREHPELIVQVAYMRRHDGPFREARRLVEEGAVGVPLVILTTSRDCYWPPEENPHETGGFLLDMAAHDYDVACWLLGQEPVEAYAARQALVYPELEPIGDLDNALVTVRFNGGGLAATHVSRTCAFGHDIRCEVVGSEGSIFIGNAASRDGVTVLQSHDLSTFPLDYRERFADAYRDELAAFVSACMGAEAPDASLADDRRAVATGVAARASAIAGQPLAVGPDWPWPTPPS